MEGWNKYFVAVDPRHASAGTEHTVFLIVFQLPVFHYVGGGGKDRGRGYPTNIHVQIDGFTGAGQKKCNWMSPKEYKLYKRGASVMWTSKMKRWELSKAKRWPYISENVWANWIERRWMCVCALVKKKEKESATRVGLTGKGKGCKPYGSCLSRSRVEMSNLRRFDMPPFVEFFFCPPGQMCSRNSRFSASR